MKVIAAPKTEDIKVVLDLLHVGFLQISIFEYILKFPQEHKILSFKH